MIKVNGIMLADLVSIKNVEIQDCLKNKYVSTFGSADSSVKLNGRINLTCGTTYTSKDELVNKLNELEKTLKDGTLEIDSKAYNVCILSELEQGMDFSNFKIVFSWDGTYVENGILYDVSK